MDVLRKFLMTVSLEIAIMKAAKIQFDVVADQVVDTKDGSRDVADVKANIHVDVANDDVDIFVAMHLDVVTIRRWKLNSGIKRLKLDLRNKVDGRD